MIKSLPAQMFSTLRSRRGRRNLQSVLWFSLVLLGVIVVYTVLFHLLMAREGQDHTWMTGFYWTLTVMSTLGFGDITFHTDLGRGFSIIVLLSGILFLLILFPFIFIEFFYEPWMQVQATTRTPRELPLDMRGHVLLTNYDAVTTALIRRLEQHHVPYALLVPELEEALRLHDTGLNVVLGALDDPEVWQRVGVERAALVVTTANDFTNTNVAFTVREISKTVSIIATASDEASVDILSLAGSSHVIRLEEMIGAAFARRTVGGDALAHVIGRFDHLLIAEASARRTPLVGKTLRESALRRNIGVSVVGIWERGSFHSPHPDTMIHDNTILVLAGLARHLHRYNEVYCIYNVSVAPAVLLGGGRVGRATARALTAREVDYRIVELRPERVRDATKCIVGNAADLDVLKKAGIDDAPTVIITPHDDDLNVYLTIYCRRLRPDIQIISRATLERNIGTLHRAGADIVMSYAGTGASTIMNWLKHSKVLTVAEGLDLFRVHVPRGLVGKTLIESKIREQTGCTVVGISTEQDMAVMPEPDTKLPEAADILLIGTAESEENFLALWETHDVLASK
ncbi:MAG: TrkA family potassium uptake protein [Candidatus Binatia bacterium]